MNGQPPSSLEPSEGSARRTVWRVVGVSVCFLCVGLVAMWLHFMWKGGVAVGLDAVGSFSLATMTDQPMPNRVRLFFTADGALLSPEMCEIGRAATTYERAVAILQAILRGPRSSGLRSPIPRGVRLRGLYVADGSATVDFSIELRDGLQRGLSAEALCIYSIVNSVLINCSELKAVTVLVEGQPVETLGGYLDLSGPLVENLTLLKETETP